MPYIILRMTDATETLINTATKNTATEFKEGCSYFGLIGENPYQVFFVAFTITKIKSHYIYIKNCGFEPHHDDPTRIFFQEYKTIKREHYSKHTINASFGKVEASNCYEFNDINVILDFLQNWDSINSVIAVKQYEEYNLTNTTLDHYYRDEERDFTIENI